MSSHYDNPLTVTYSFLNDFGAGDELLALKAPAGLTRGRIREVGVAVKETFNGVTTNAFIRIGTATDADAYVEMDMAAAADTNYYNTLDDTDAIINADIPSATQVEVALIAPTGGTPAGIGVVSVVIDWFG